MDDFLLIEPTPRLVTLKRPCWVMPVEVMELTVFRFPADFSVFIKGWFEVSRLAKLLSEQELRGLRFGRMFWLRSTGRTFFSMGGGFIHKSPRLLLDQRIFLSDKTYPKPMLAFEDSILSSLIGPSKGNLF